MQIPSDLLQQISEPGGGRVVLVAGAGCSIEYPTVLKTGGDYSQAAYRRLVADGILVEDACPAPRDLSLVAEIVFAETGSQRELTTRLPKDAWRTASPNSRHYAAAALLIEGALRAIVTLNYDLAFQNALSTLGRPADVAIVRGPEDHRQSSSRNLVFLHRSVESDEEQWVLRKSVLDDAWREGWEEFIAHGALAAPEVVFCGLGSPAAVLTDSVKRLTSSSGTNFTLVDPYTDTAFAKELQAELRDIIICGWCSFATALADRVLAEQVSQLQDACGDVAKTESLDEQDATQILQALTPLGLVHFGRVRSVWIQADTTYAPDRAGIERACVADLVLALGRVANLTGASMTINQDAVLTLTLPDGRHATLISVHGAGVRTWSSIETRIRQHLTDRVPVGGPRVVLVAGVRPEPNSLPSDLIRKETSDDLVRGASVLIPVEAQAVRAVPPVTADALWRTLAA